MERVTMSVANSFPHKYPLTINHFQKMIETGIFDEDEHIELIEGELLVMAPIGPVHSSQTRKLNRLFSQSVGDLAIVDIQNPIVLDDNSEPEPDMALLRPRDDFYETATPRTHDVLLLVEVADSTLSYDKNTKIPLYARHGIPEVWLINVPNKQVEIYLKPSPEGYRKILLPEKHEQISPTLLPTVSVKVSDIIA
jgi:Uma2 family endonuclease